MSFIYILNFYKNSKLHTYEVFNIFFAYHMSRSPTIHFQLSIMSQWFVKHIRTKVSFQNTNTKTHVYIDIRWPWIWKPYFYLGIWNDDRTKIIVLPSFQQATRLNSQKRYETEVINQLWHINLYMNIGNSNCIIEVSIARNEGFYFISVPYTITDLLHLKHFSSYLVWRNGAMGKTCFSATQNAKKKNYLKLVNQVRDRRFIDCYVFEYEKLYSSLRGEHITLKRLH